MCHQVVIAFAYYNQGIDEIPATPSYIVVEGEVPGILHRGMNISAEQIVAAGQPVPATPTYKEWMESGSKVYRGEL